MPLKKQNTRTAEISLDKRGFMKIKILPDSIIDVEDALDNLLVIKSFSSGKKILKLIDLSHLYASECYGFSHCRMIKKVSL